MEVVRAGAAGIHHEQDGAFQLSVILLPMFPSKALLTQISAFREILFLHPLTPGHFLEADSVLSSSVNPAVDSGIRAEREGCEVGSCPLELWGEG